MRLTLRNLLAYLHEMMSPEDRAAFAPLVKNAPRVQQLLDRCKEVAQRRTLAAPALEQAHEKHAADTVGRYLDFQLPDQQLATFERAALDSDEQLAEIVDCHRILADVVLQKVSDQSPAWKSRIYALLTKPQSASVGQAASNGDDDEYALAPAAEVVKPGEIASAEPPKKVDAQSPMMSIQRVAEETLLTDSGDLSQYLDEDDEELSEEAARAMEKKKQQQLAAAAKTASGVTGSATSAVAAAPKLTNYGVRDPYKDRNAPPPVPVTLQEPKFELAVPLPLLIGGGAGVLALLGGIVMLSMWMFSGPTKPKVTGPHVYGIAASDSSPTVEMSGMITYSVGGSPVPDSGAIIAAWPVDATPAIKLTAITVMEDLNSKKQNAYNEQLVVAKTDEAGRFRMRMHEHATYHVMVMSEGMKADVAKTWTDEINSLKSQVEDPASLVGQRVYFYTKANTGPDKTITLDHFFESK